MFHLAVPLCALHRDTGQWGERALKSGSGPFESPVLMLARGRGPVLTSHLFTKAFAYLEGETSSFQKGTMRAGDVLHLGLGAASARSRGSSKATATQTGMGASHLK